MQTHELAREQLMLELVNRARMNPVGEAKKYGIALNQGLPAGTISSAPKQVLAGNYKLGASADNHSAFMLSHDKFDHQAIGDGNPGTRMASAGYAFTGDWTWGENIAWAGTTGTATVVFYDAQVAIEHRNLFLSHGHRENILGDDFKEIGIGAKAGQYTSYDALMVTQNFAKSGSGSFVTGVAYNDSVNNDNFYSIGEGKSGIAAKLYSSGGTLLKSASTASAGGYAIKTTATGALELVFSGGAATGNIGAKFSLGSTNVKVDLVDGNDIESNVSVTLTRDANGLRMLGIQNINGTGTSGDNWITGNTGNNTLKGMGGIDWLAGGGGNDLLIGGDGADQLSGGSGADHYRYTAASEGGDRITTFEATDFIEFSSAGFGGLAVGAVAAVNFVSRSADNLAQDADDYFVFNQSDATVWFDADGNGATAAIMIADLGNSFAVTRSDLLVV